MLNNKNRVSRNLRVKMTGMVFIVTIPRKEHEEHLKTNEQCKKKVTIIQDHNQEGSANEFNKLSSNTSPIRVGYEYSSMEKLIHDVLVFNKLENNACYHQIEERYLQVVFSVEEGTKCEDILDFFRENNIGAWYDSTISIIPCSLYYQGCETDVSSYGNNIEQDGTNKDTAWARFVSSVRARLTVAQVVESLKTDAALTFDFICLLVIAALLCAIGLVEDSNIYLLSSMLISPMMGPVMAGTFGTVIGDRLLLKTGVQSELLGLGVAMLVGFFYGAIICFCTNRYGQVDWPTSEMVSRGEVRNLGVGCLVALLSGAAVAVGVLSDNIASLVGVAISTSLMPPAVNAGLLWSLATVYYLKGNETTRYEGLTLNNYYSTDKFIDLVCLGGISICLTFVNIICIYVAGLFIFKIKEVAPVRMKNETRQQFWKHDIRITRDYNKTIQKEEALAMAAELKSEIIQQKVVSGRYSSPNNSYLQKSLQSCSPNVIISKRPTIQELQELYKNITRENLSPTFSFGSGRRLSQVIDTDFSASPQLLHSHSPAQFMHKKFTVTPCTLE